MRRTDVIALAVIVAAVVSWLAGGGVLPVPVPEPGPRSVYLLEQDADRRQHPEFVRLIGDAGLRRSLEGRGHVYRLVDRENAGDQYGHLFEQAESLPWLVIKAGDRTVYSGPVPTPLETFLEHLREHGG